MAKTDEKKEPEAKGEKVEEPGTDVEKIAPAGVPAEQSDEDLLAEMRQEAAIARGEMDLANDVQLPGLVMVQATSGYVNEGLAKPGDLIQNLTNEAWPEVEVIVARMFKSRVRFGPELGDRPLCTSPDAIEGFGDPGDELPKKGVNGGGLCETCPHSNWRQGGRCQLRYNYMGVLLGGDGEERDWEHELPIGFMMHGTSAKIATRLNSVLVGQDLFWDTTILLSSTPGENDKGKFRIWAFKKGRPTAWEEKKKAMSVAKQLRAAQRVTVRDQETPGGGSGDDDIPF